MSETGALTPNDLRNQEFKGKMRGYDPLEVSAVLEEVAAQWEQLLAENLRLREQNSAVNEQLKKYSGLEQTLRDTLVLARKAAEGEAETAKKEAAVLVEQARLKSEALVRDAEARAEEFRRQIHELQAQRSRLKGEMEALLRSFVEQLEQFDTRIASPSNNNPETPDTQPAKPYSEPVHPPAVRSEEPKSTAYIAPATTVAIPADDSPGSGDDHSIDFDDALSKIFGEDRDTPVPPVEKPRFTGDEGDEKEDSDKIHSAFDESRRSDADKQDTD